MLIFRLDGSKLFKKQLKGVRCTEILHYHLSVCCDGLLWCPNFLPFQVAALLVLKNDHFTGV